MNTWFAISFLSENRTHLFLSLSLTLSFGCKSRKRRMVIRVKKCCRIHKFRVCRNPLGFNFFIFSYWKCKKGKMMEYISYLFSFRRSCIRCSFCFIGNPILINSVKIKIWKLREINIFEFPIFFLFADLSCTLALHHCIPI